MIRNAGIKGCQDMKGVLADLNQHLRQPILWTWVIGDYFSTENGAGSPALLKPGRNGRSLRAGCGWGCMPSSCLVAIAVRASDELTKAVRHIGDFAVFRGEVEGSPGSHGDAPDMRAPRGKLLWDHSPHQVSCLKAKVPFVPLPRAHWEPKLIGVAHATMAASCRPDQQREYIRCLQSRRRRGPNAGGVQPMCFWQVPPYPIVLRASA